MLRKIITIKGQPKVHILIGNTNIYLNLDFYDIFISGIRLIFNFVSSNFVFSFHTKEIYPQRFFVVSVLIYA